MEIMFWDVWFHLFWKDSNNSVPYITPRVKVRTDILLLYLKVFVVQSFPDEKFEKNSISLVVTETSVLLFTNDIWSVFEHASVMLLYENTG